MILSAKEPSKALQIPHFSLKPETSHADKPKIKALIISANNPRVKNSRGAPTK